MTIERGLRITKNIALKSNYKNSQNRFIRIGAAVFNKKGYLIATNVNQKKTHHLMAYYNKEMPFNRIPYLHAEIAALLKARWAIGEKGLKGCTVFVARKLNKEGWGLAKPCPACRKAMIDMGVNKIVYTTETGFSVEYLDK